jgi:DNA-binding NarL/FixJ family response regulator
VHRIDSAGTAEVRRLYSRTPADVVLVGTQRAVPAGVNAVRGLVAAYPEATVIVFGSPDDADSIAAAILGGAQGFLRWDTAHPGVVSTVTPPVTSTAVRAPDRGVQLTERELQVLTGMSKGHSNGQIGRELFLAEDTVKTHARRLFRKLGVVDRAEAVAHGFRRRLVT